MSSNHQQTPSEDTVASSPNVVVWAPPDCLAYVLFIGGFFTVATVATVASDVICQVYRIDDFGKFGVSVAVIAALGALVLGQNWLTRARMAKPPQTSQSKWRSSQASNDKKRPSSVGNLLIVPLIAPFAVVAGATLAIVAQSFGINGRGQVVLLGFATALTFCPLYLGVLYFCAKLITTEPLAAVLISSAPDHSLIAARRR